MTRPRGLRYTRDPLSQRRLPRFPIRERPERPDPFDGGDYSSYRDPEPLSWSDLKDPANLIGGLLVLAAIVLFIFGASIVDMKP